MLRHILLNSTAPADYDLVVATMVARSTAHSPSSSLNTSLLRPTAAAAGGRGGGGGGGGGDAGLRDGELHKPDLVTYIVMCLLLFVLVLLIVFFINCQLRNSFFASMPYDRSLREARTSYK